MRLPELTPAEQDLLRRAGDLGVTHRRIRAVVMIAMSLATLLLIMGPRLLPHRTLLLLFVAYIGITAWEKVSYGRAVLRYKSLIQKLAGEIERNL